MSTPKVAIGYHLVESNIYICSDLQLQVENTKQQSKPRSSNNSWEIINPMNVIVSNTQAERQSSVARRNFAILLHYYLLYNYIESNCSNGIINVTVIALIELQLYIVE